MHLWAVGNYNRHFSLFPDIDNEWKIMIFLCFIRESQSLLDPVLLKGLGWKGILVTGSEMKGRGQERCSHSQAQYGCNTVWICVCVHIYASVCIYICLQIYRYIFICMYLNFYFYSIYALVQPFVCNLSSSCQYTGTVFVVCQSIYLLGPWSLLWKVHGNISV